MHVLSLPKGWSSKKDKGPGAMSRSHHAHDILGFELRLFATPIGFAVSFPRSASSGLLAPELGPVQKLFDRGPPAMNLGKRYSSTRHEIHGAGC